MRPLKMKQIADELDIHASTVSRICNQKYLSCSRGVFEFKHFFSTVMVNVESGTNTSATAVRAAIVSLVASEDKNNPDDDQRLSEKLSAQGIVVARRTISKYRNQLKIPSAILRRKELL